MSEAPKGGRKPAQGERGAENATFRDRRQDGKAITRAPADKMMRPGRASRDYETK